MAIFARKLTNMQHILDPIVALILWSFETLLEPLGELPGLLNPNTVFVLLISLGLLYWIVQQGKYNKKAEAEGGLK